MQVRPIAGLLVVILFVSGCASTGPAQPGPDAPPVVERSKVTRTELTWSGVRDMLPDLSAPARAEPTGDSDPVDAATQRVGRVVQTVVFAPVFLLAFLFYPFFPWSYG